MAAIDAYFWGKISAENLEFYVRLIARFTDDLRKLAKEYKTTQRDIRNRLKDHFKKIGQHIRQVNPDLYQRFRQRLDQDIKAPALVFDEEAKQMRRLVQAYKQKAIDFAQLMHLVKPYRGKFSLAKITLPDDYKSYLNTKFEGNEIKIAFGVYFVIQEKGTGNEKEGVFVVTHEASLDDLNQAVLRRLVVEKAEQVDQFVVETQYVEEDDTLIEARADILQELVEKILDQSVWGVTQATSDAGKAYKLSSSFFATLLSLKVTGILGAAEPYVMLTVAGATLLWLLRWLMRRYGRDAAQFIKDTIYKYYKIRTLSTSQLIQDAEDAVVHNPVPYRRLRIIAKDVRKTWMVDLYLWPT